MHARQRAGRNLQPEQARTRLPERVAASVLAENSSRKPVAARGRALRAAERHRGACGLEAWRSAAEGDLVRARPRAAAGLHGRPVRGRSGGDARRHDPPRRQSRSRQSAAAGRARHRSLGAGRLLRPQRRVSAERRARVRAQPRALFVSAVGPGRVQEFPRRAARYRHRPSGEHRIPRARGVPRGMSTARCAPFPTRSWAPTRTRRW